MIYDSGVRFKRQMSIGGDVYGDSYDVMCRATDDLGEMCPSLTIQNVFSVQNSASIVDEISIQSEVHKYETMRIYCDGSDPDGIPEGNLTATLFMKTDNSAFPPWNRINGVTMDYDGNDHYYDFEVPDDSGTEYDIRCILSDGDLEGTRDEFKFEDNSSFVGIIDDWDNDGVSDALDTIGGSGSTITSNLDSLDITFDEVSGLTTTTGNKKVEFKSGGNTLVRFYNDFDVGNLELVPVSITKSNQAGQEYLIINGLSYTGIIKSLFLEKSVPASLVCAKDAKINSISEISHDCSAPDEYLFTSCVGGSETIGNVTCTDLGDYYQIDGLTHSAVTEFGNAGLMVESDSDYGYVVPANLINIYANYYNLSSDGIILDADCDIYFADTGWSNMTFVGDKYLYSRAFGADGNYDYNISCSATGYSALALSDSVRIGMDAGVVPEFNGFTLLVGLLAVLVGIMAIRRKSNE